MRPSKRVAMFRAISSYRLRGMRTISLYSSPSEKRGMNFWFGAMNDMIVQEHRTMHRLPPLPPPSAWKIDGVALATPNGWHVVEFDTGKPKP